ncbi:hypothetical protein HPP92_000587 [Vanilla planifolia]|uniref:RRM domain-containing protein n=1 Tax=Vanilla planifolia TaxID=51239 RepID=A0A835VGR8_VANPL|nr:hypothetical protein HPP92_000587 [Vanilla planifolia]
MAAVAENALGADDQYIHRQSASCNQETNYERDVRKLVDLLSKLNPSAKEFFPSSYTAVGQELDGRPSADAQVFVGTNGYYYSSNANSNKDSGSDGSPNNQQLNRRRRNSYNQGRRRTAMRTVIRIQAVMDLPTINNSIAGGGIAITRAGGGVTEEHLAELFAACGQVVDCRVCGDPHSILRFAFIEFADEEGARAALNLGGTMLGFYPVRVLPSKTAILPVNPKFLPRSNDEREMVVRTVYCTNIDKKVTQSEVKQFFEQVCCGEVSRIRLLGDNVHSTRIAFVEFVLAESAILALNCSGMVLGSLPIRVSPSKTPVRSRIPRAASN